MDRSHLILDGWVLQIYSLRFRLGERAYLGVKETLVGEASGMGGSILGMVMETFCHLWESRAIRGEPGRCGLGQNPERSDSLGKKRKEMRGIQPSPNLVRSTARGWADGPGMNEAQNELTGRSFFFVTRLGIITRSEGNLT